MIEQLNNIVVMFVESLNGVNGSKEAFDRLEALLPGLRGRKFYGVIFNSGKYRACVRVEQTDEPGGFGLKTFTIPGGIYAKTKLKNWADNISEIGKLFNKMAAEFIQDENRPCIEFYKSRTELIIYLPVHKEYL